MVTLKISKMCGCVKKSGMAENQSFEDIDTALTKANEMTTEMNETFCKKHNFTVVNNGDNELVIEVAMNKR